MQARRMMAKQFLVTAEWDDEAQVYVATSDDIPGLVTEAPTLDLLRERVLAVVPELLADNAHHVADEDEFSDLVRLCVESSFTIGRARAM